MVERERERDGRSFHNGSPVNRIGSEVYRVSDNRKQVRFVARGLSSRPADLEGFSVRLFRFRRWRAEIEEGRRRWGRVNLRQGAPMAVSIPTTLIRGIQNRLREGAGVPSYDPADPALRCLPAAEEPISGLDPSAPSHPQFISFNATVGYRRLLQSLDLDGSVSYFVYPSPEDVDFRRW